ncbi:hypothetical protein MGYG_04076 [Nannizzia gypsea CBS 118893]|uniref:Uncharacterized protein n=1 Tax=Arthroderma gypseum (strain ATCC MYA-4604 / CBS 118893) TaxID=535722 RepID=E4UUV6_ARTGP|nr:hypothetical protein MGYG_04076 [Nannizzia gypsea CBS 118893]EFR01073.1 hypothetical protein MGYG_04076 [Nannizzia gypsea CBS 118893]
MAEGDNGVLAALGALLGYVGAEAATTAPFEHLLWPQRQLSNFSWRSAATAALLMPMGGPLHKAALETFDALHRHGLFRGSHRGHMLSTAFFREIGWTYTMHDLGFTGKPKAIRNCLWVSALSLLGSPQLDGGSRQEEKREIARDQEVRARISCHHLIFSQATEEDKASAALPCVREGVKTPGPRIFLLLLATESTAVILAVILAVIWKTFWAILWLAPLILRLLSALFAVHREPLQSPKLTPKDHPCDFEIHSPESNGDFMVFTGPPALIQQFMRHYGHPCRSRTRESLQLTIIFLLGCVFPLGLVASTLFMPLYLRRLSTDAAIVEAFERDERFASRGEGSLLFGQTRHSPGTIRVDLKVKSYGKHAAARKAAQELLIGRNEDIEATLGEELQ